MTRADVGTLDYVMSFPTSFILLQREAHLAQGTLSIGLTALRNAVFPDIPAVYSGFFNTSIALERVMKLIVVSDHMVMNAFAAPEKKELLGYGHDLVELYSSCAAVALRQNSTPFELPIRGSIECEILEFLSEFAKRSRYYNLDALSSSPQGYGNPLERWSKVLGDVLNADVPKGKISQALARIDAFSRAMEGYMHTIQHGMDGSRLTAEEVFRIPALQAMATPYAMVHVFRILTPLLETLARLGRRGFYDSPRTDGPRIPEFSEFFYAFGGSDAEIRRKKRWP